MQQLHHAVAFGAQWAGDWPLHRFLQCTPGARAPDIVVRKSLRPESARTVLMTAGGHALYADGVRFHAGGEAVFETYGGHCVECLPGRDWQGRVPEEFFGTLTAFLMAARGHLPMHGTAVLVHDKAVLLCGASGAGKSSLAAAMIALGAELISDDLSVMAYSSATRELMLHAGRPAIRLYPLVTEYLQRLNTPLRVECVAGDKDRVYLPQSAPELGVPLGAICMLGADSAAMSPDARAALLGANLFRPGWLRHMSGHAERCDLLNSFPLKLPMIALPPTPVVSFDPWLAHARMVLCDLDDLLLITNG